MKDKNFKFIRHILGSLLGALLLLASTNLLAASQAPLQPVGAGGFLQVFFGLILVLGIIIAGAWFLRRFGNFQTTANGALRVVGGLSVGTRERVVLVQVGDKQILLGIAPGRVQTLHVLEEPLPLAVASSQGSGEGFAARLAAALKQGRA